MKDDLISRQAAIDAIDKIFPADPMRNDYTQGITCGAALATEYIKQLPSAQPEYRLDEWCTNCKEYDQEKHCCPRFNRVIQTTLQEMQSELKKGKWVRETFEEWWCNQCGSEICTETPENYHYCPNCGADMRGEQDE